MDAPESGVPKPERSISLNSRVIKVTTPNLNAVNSNLDNDDQTSAGKGDVEA